MNVAQVDKNKSDGEDAEFEKCEGAHDTSCPLACQICGSLDHEALDCDQDIQEICKEGRCNSKYELSKMGFVQSIFRQLKA